MALLWASLVFYLLLMPGDNAIVSDTSHAFGGTALTDAIGHVILFGVLTGLVYRVFAFYLSPTKAFYATLGTILVLGTCIELAQYLVPERGVAMLDLSANWLGALIFAGYERAQGRADPP
jgi:VanZ family protein